MLSPPPPPQALTFQKTSLGLFMCCQRGSQHPEQA